ncbi:MAG: hypothetical protein HC809_17270 [Gammaproteobacteria bacterium]|nr:hypothetical protein [Gammaproteobacteria bacterium]
MLVGRQHLGRLLTEVRYAIYIHAACAPRDAGDKRICKQFRAGGGGNPAGQFSAPGR